MVVSRLPRHAPAFAAALLSAACLPPAHAAADAKKDGHWRGLVGASLAATAGNTESNSLALNLDVARQTQHTKISVQGFINRAESKVDGERTTTADKWGLSSQYDSDISLRWFAFGKVGFDRDRLIDLSLRSTVSGGLGYHMIDTEDQTLNLFGGLSYTDRRYSADQTLHGTTSRHFSNPGALIGQEYSQQLDGSRVVFKERLELYPDLSQDHAHLARFNASLNVSISRTLSLSVGLVSTYNHNVPAGTKKTDTTLLTGLNIKLGD
jgi:putative salt-induced outer membrane protein